MCDFNFFLCWDMYQVFSDKSYITLYMRVSADISPHNVGLSRSNVTVGRSSLTRKPTVNNSERM